MLNHTNISLHKEFAIPPSRPTIRFASLAPLGRLAHGEPLCYPPTMPKERIAIVTTSDNKPNRKKLEQILEEIGGADDDVLMAEFGGIAFALNHLFSKKDVKKVKSLCEEHTKEIQTCSIGKKKEMKQKLKKGELPSPKPEFKKKKRRKTKKLAKRILWWLTKEGK